MDYNADQKVPHVDGDPYSGITMRQYFAAKAMQGLLSSMTEKSANGRWGEELSEIAKASVELADELLKALEA